MLLSFAAEATIPIFNQIISSLITPEAAVTSEKMLLCWTCPLVEGLYRGMSTVANSALGAYGNKLFALLGLGALFFVLFRILSFFTALQPVGFWDAFSEFLKFFGRVLFAVVMLIFIQDIFRLVINPILELSLALATKLQELGDFSAKVTQVVSDQMTAMDTSYNSTCDTLVCKVPAEYTILSQEVCTRIVRLICTFNTTLVVGMSVSVAIIIAGATAFVKGSYQANIYAMLAGGFMGAGFLFLVIRVPALFLDAIFRITFVFVLSPIYVVLWVFPQTVQYTKKAWDIVVYTCVLFVCLSGFIILATYLLGYVFSGKDPETQELLFKYLQNGMYEEAGSLLGFQGYMLLSTIAICFVGTKIIDMAVPLTNQLVGNVPDVGISALYGKLSGKLTKWIGEYIGGGGP